MAKIKRGETGYRAEEPQNPALIRRIFSMRRRKLTFREIGAELEMSAMNVNTHYRRWHDWAVSKNLV